MVISNLLITISTRTYYRIQSFVCLLFVDYLNYSYFTSDFASSFIIMYFKWGLAPADFVGVLDARRPFVGKFCEEAMVVERTEKCF